MADFLVVLHSAANEYQSVGVFTNCDTGAIANSRAAIQIKTDGKFTALPLANAVTQTVELVQDTANTTAPFSDE